MGKQNAAPELDFSGGPDLDMLVKPYLHITDQEFAKMKPRTFDLGEGVIVGKASFQLMVQRRRVKVI